MSTPDRRATAAQRFWAKVDRGEGCWVWRGGGARDGAFRVGRRVVRAHRFSYELAYGPLAPGMRVGRSCRNRACVAPGHLYALPVEEFEHGRRVRAEAHGRAKLTAAHVREAREAASQGASERSLARRFGVSPSAMHNALVGKTWKEP